MLLQPDRLRVPVVSAVPEREHAHTYGLSCPADGCRWPSLATGGIIRQPETSGSYQPLMPGGESTSAQLRRVRQERDEALSAFGVAEELRLKTVAERDKAANTVGWLQAQNTVLLEERDTLRAELAETFRKAGHLRQERDQLSAAVAGWVARFHAAYEALYIEEFDGDSCPDLETTIAYAIGAYRRVCESESEAADQISLLRAELASAQGELKQLREHQEIRARVIREKNAKLREVEHLLGIDALVPPADVADAVRDLLAELARLRTDLAAERATAAQLRADYAEAADELGSRTIPTSKEKTT